jgi:hypothetical protein
MRWQNPGGQRFESTAARHLGTRYRRQNPPFCAPQLEAGCRGGLPIAKLLMRSSKASLAPARQHARNDLPAVPPIDAEICVRSQQHGFVQRLGHADEAGIRETHRHVGIFLQQLEHGIHVVAENGSRRRGRLGEATAIARDSDAVARVLESQSVPR